eukprot:CAMPEP_0201569220 /NCGR_PEP_ID=MMETSP0190_2-20130828/10784_1 /ASSEMBLY_ACC=CAM_ASM_000263 /TAXON_ID=37353 /ORGANISM="Rosalina sp." /LENGTH=569 /DNA_ID=CAMNT_0047991307 /DNA_START=324 /DNA_END=2033 /DNA_ORIENTATION=-
MKVFNEVKTLNSIPNMVWDITRIRDEAVNKHLETLYHKYDGPDFQHLKQRANKSKSPKNTVKIDNAICLTAVYNRQGYLDRCKNSQEEWFRKFDGELIAQSISQVAIVLNDCPRAKVQFGYGLLMKKVKFPKAKETELIPNSWIFAGKLNNNKILNSLFKIVGIDNNNKEILETKKKKQEMRELLQRWCQEILQHTRDDEMKIDEDHNDNGHIDISQQSYLQTTDHIETTQGTHNPSWSNLHYGVNGQQQNTGYNGNNIGMNGNNNYYDPNVSNAQMMVISGNSTRNRLLSQQQPSCINSNKTYSQSKEYGHHQQYQQHHQPQQEMKMNVGHNTHHNFYTSNDTSSTPLYSTAQAHFSHQQQRPHNNCPQFYPSCPPPMYVTGNNHMLAMRPRMMHFQHQQYPIHTAPIPIMNHNIDTDPRQSMVMTTQMSNNMIWNNTKQMNNSVVNDTDTGHHGYHSNNGISISSQYQSHVINDNNGNVANIQQSQMDNNNSNDYNDHEMNNFIGFRNSCTHDMGSNPLNNYNNDNQTNNLNGNDVQLENAGLPHFANQEMGNSPLNNRHHLRYHFQ